MALINLEDVTKIYRMGEVEVGALQGVSLEIEEGEMVAVIGPSGSGKSTLMNVVGCLDAPTSGRYELEGQDISRMSDSRLSEIRGRQIGFVFQTYNLLPRLTARANVELPLMYNSGSDRKRRAMEALEIGRARRPGQPQANRAIGGSAATGGHSPGPRQGAEHHAGG